MTRINTATLATTTVTLPAGADPRDIELSADDTTAWVVSGNITGADMLWQIDVANATMVGGISLGTAASNANVVSVAPTPTTCL